MVFCMKVKQVHKITCLSSFKHSASIQTIWTCNSGQVSANSRTCIQGDITCYLQRSNLSPFYRNWCSIFYKICNQQTTWKKVNFHQFANKNLFFFTFMWPCIITNFFITKPTRCTNFTNLFWHETLHVSDTSSVHHQKFIHCTLSNGISHTEISQMGKNY